MTPEQLAARREAIRRAVNGPDEDYFAAQASVGKLIPRTGPNHPEWGKVRAYELPRTGQSVDYQARLEAQGKRYPPQMPVELVLPWAPTDNHQVKHTKSGKHYLTTEANNFRAEVAHEAKQRRIRGLEGDLVLSIEAHPPDKRRRDVANLFKSVCDALQHAGVVADDYQFTVLTIKRREVIKNGVLKCRIYGA